MTEGAANDPGTRGSLTVADRVVDKIAGRAALEVTSVVAGGSGLGKVVGRKLPKVTNDTRGSQTRIGLDVAVTWPHSAPDTAGEVRTAVSRAVTELAGLEVRAVDVTVRSFAAARIPDNRRVT